MQPHAGAQANTAVYHALLQPGDTIMGLALPHGGHLTHGMKLNVSGRLYDIAPYEVDRETSLIDMDEVARIARERRPKLHTRRLVAPTRASSTSRASARSPTRSARCSMVDMAHFAGLVAAGLHPSPVPARRRRHLDRPQDARRRARRPDPLHARSTPRRSTRRSSPASRAARWSTSIAGKAVALQDRDDRGLPRAPAAHASTGAQAVAEELLQAGDGVNVLTGGTDVHLVLVDLRESELDGQQAEDRLHDIGITVNRNAVPVRPAPADGHQRPARRHAGAGHPRPAGRRLRRGRADHRRGADARLRRPRATSWPSASPRSPSATRSTSTSRPARRSSARRGRAARAVARPARLPC